MSKGSQATPLTALWTSAGIKVFDPVTRSKRTGPTLSSCLDPGDAGRDLIVAVGRQSAFVRNVFVPTLSKDEIAKMISFKMGPLLPLAPGEYVTGFRVGADVAGEGRLAVVAAVKTETLRRIYAEAATARVRVRTVVPTVFGSWLSARAKGLSHCAVVEANGPSLGIDIVADGEIRYSRTVPMPADQQEIEDAIASTFETAQVAAGPVVSLGETPMVANHADPKESFEYLADTHSLDRLLFTLELPEVVATRSARARSRHAQRALTAAALAAVVSGYAFLSYRIAESKAERERKLQMAMYNDARKRQTAAETQNIQSHEQKMILDAAFHPAQSFLDATKTFTALSPSDVWLTGLLLERGKPVVLRGESLSGKTAAKYVKELTKEPRFRKMKLQFANKAAIGKHTIVRFSIIGHMVGNLPIDSLPKKGVKA